MGGLFVFEVTLSAKQRLSFFRTDELLGAGEACLRTLADAPRTVQPHLTFQVLPTLDCATNAFVS